MLHLTFIPFTTALEISPLHAFCPCLRGSPPTLPKLGISLSLMLCGQKWEICLVTAPFPLSHVSTQDCEVLSLSPVVGISEDSIDP